MNENLEDGATSGKSRRYSSVPIALLPETRTYGRKTLGFKMKPGVGDVANERGSKEESDSQGESDSGDSSPRKVRYSKILRHKALGARGTQRLKHDKKKESAPLGGDCTVCLGSGRDPSGRPCSCSVPSTSFPPLNSIIGLQQVAIQYMQQHQQQQQQEQQQQPSSSKKRYTTSPSINQTRPHACPICGQWFLMREKLVLHEVMNHGMRHCRHCSAVFPSADEEEEHRKANHLPPVCETCKRPFQNAVALARHLSAAHDVCTCLLCGVLVRPRASYALHVRRKHFCVREDYDDETVGEWGSPEVPAEIEGEIEETAILPNLIEDADGAWSFMCRLCGKERRKTDLFGHFFSYHRLSLPCLVDLLWQELGRVVIAGAPPARSPNREEDDEDPDVMPPPIQSPPATRQIKQTTTSAPSTTEEENADEEEETSCSVCGSSYPTEGDVTTTPKQAHMVFCSRKPFCRACGFTTLSEEELEKHADSVCPLSTALWPELGGVPCPFCRAPVSDGASGYEKHMVTEHGWQRTGNADPPIVCDDLLRPGPSITCALCGEQSGVTLGKDVHSLFEHLQNHSLTLGPALFTLSSISNALERAADPDVPDLGLDGEDLGIGEKGEEGNYDSSDEGGSSIDFEDMESYVGGMDFSGMDACEDEDDDIVPPNALDTDLGEADIDPHDVQLLIGDASSGDEDDSLLRPSRVEKLDEAIAGIPAAERNSLEPLECELCPMQFDSGNEYRLHLQAVHRMVFGGTEEPKVKIEPKVRSPRACRFCSLQFQSRWERSGHEVGVHQGERESFYRCYACDDTFSSRVCVRRHMESAHPDELPYDKRMVFKCRRCLVLFPRLGALKDHSRIKHPGAIVYNCRFCPSVLKTRKTLRQHAKQVVHSESRRRECSLCGKVLWSKRAYGIHYRMKHSKTTKVGFRCRICQKRFDSKDERKLHYQIDHENESPYHCPDCGKGFASKSGMYGHRQLHTGTGISRCEHCGKEFTRKDSYNEHLLIHNGPRHKCPHCPKEFVQRSNLVRHIRIHTGEKPYKCTHCDKRFSDKGACNSHIRVHTREETCSCPYCGQTFSKKQKLKYHIRKHTGEGLINCEICGKSFTNSFALKEHRVIHNRQTQILCPQCGKGFNSEKYLQRHITIVHEPSNAFPCPLCEKVFSQQSRLRAHLMTHTGLKHMRCLLCDKAYSVRKSLRRHLLEKHHISPEHPHYKRCFHAMSPEEAGLPLLAAARALALGAAAAAAHAAAVGGVDVSGGEAEPRGEQEDDDDEDDDDDEEDDESDGSPDGEGSGDPPQPWPVDMTWTAGREAEGVSRGRGRRGRGRSASRRGEGTTRGRPRRSPGRPRGSRASTASRGSVVPSAPRRRGSTTGKKRRVEAIAESLMQNTKGILLGIGEESRDTGTSGGTGEGGDEPSREAVVGVSGAGPSDDPCVVSIKQESSEGDDENMVGNNGVEEKDRRKSQVSEMGAHWLAGE
ncbi:uncharacterized protein [Hetaerina americana]|uniref:uncharacterized protein isoform X1 n=1 Tax=Hetaerina americana TaxID=62018 RepID=UPI003A7F433A